MQIPWWLPFGRVPEVTSLQLRRDLQGSSPPQLLDVRTPQEFALSHIDGAVNVPVTALPGCLPALDLDRRRPVVAICLTAHRSVPAVRLLRQHGLDARQLVGGMLAWWSSAEW
jgi:rhodanese-related sulfurtransferase